MAVKIKFDNTYNVIQPTFILATRSGHKLGAIPAVNISVSDNFNSSFELEFNVYKDDNGQQYPLWDKLTDFKLMWCREWDVWFEIYVTTQAENSTVKNVNCVSLGEAELSQINIYNTEINTEDDIARDDYIPTIIYNPDKPEGSLLHRIMEKAPHYTISHVDSRIAKMQRTFSFDGDSLYDVFQQIAEELDCIFIIDSGTDDDGSISRSISVYDIESYCADCGHRDSFTGKCPKCGSTNILSGYGEDTNIFVSTENLADNITLETDTGSVKNCFRLEAGDDLMTATIRNCNPNGSQYIWYISDELRNDMSDELVQKLADYDESYNYYYDEYNAAITGSIVTQYNALINKYKTYNEDLTTIPTSIVGYSELMNVYYGVIDMYLFLHDNFMPSVETSSTTAALEAAKLTSSELSPVAVQNIDTCSSSTASSAVLSIARTVVDQRYQVKVKNGTLTNNVWTGNFTVTNYSDDTDTAESATISVTINDDYETFTRQKISKILKNAAEEDDTNDITTIFKLDLSSFKLKLKEYCLSTLNIFADACQSCLNILIEQGIADKETWADQNPDLYSTLYLDYYNKLSAIQAEVKIRESEIAIVIGTYDEYGDLKTDGIQTLVEKEKNKIQDILNMEQYLGSDLWLELVSYRREDTYSNDNYISDGLDNGELFSRALEFIEVAKKEVYKSAVLQHSISADLKNLLVMKEFKPIVNNFSVGNWIRVEIDGEIYRLRLISYSIDFDNLDNISVEFSDVTKYADGMSDTKSIIDQASSMATSYSAVTRQASQGSKSNKQLTSWVNDGLALTKMKIVDNADNQNITWDAHGLLCKEYLPITDDYSDKQLKIINRGLYLTDDNWLTSKAGIGDFTFYNPETQKFEESYGVIADTLVGNLVLSEKVGVYNTSGSVNITEDGLLIVADGVSGDNTMNFTIAKTTDAKGTTENVLYVDTDGNLVGKFNSLTITGAGGNVLTSTQVQGLLDSAITALEEDLQEQIDGKVETWCQNTDPAAEWTTATLKAQHNGDLWYYTGVTDLTVNGVTIKPSKSYQYDNSTGKWVLYKSSSTSLFDFADGKSTIYYGKTTDTYTNVETGDYLVDSTDGCTYRWSGSSWVKQTDYNSAITAYDSTLDQETVFNKLTNNGALQGIYMSNSDLYLNASYIKTGTLTSIAIQNGSASSSGTYPFTVDKYGNLTATSATIKGDIYATTGNIGGSGGWTITSKKMYNGAYGKENSMYLGGTDLGSAEIAGTTLSTWRFTMGANFGVTNAGVLYAKGANISGNFTMNGGIINIDSDENTSYITLSYDVTSNKSGYIKTTKISADSVTKTYTTGTGYKVETSMTAYSLYSASYDASGNLEDSASFAYGGATLFNSDRTKQCIINGNSIRMIQFSSSSSSTSSVYTSITPTGITTTGKYSGNLNSDIFKLKEVSVSLGSLASDGYVDSSTTVTADSGYTIIGVAGWWLTTTDGRAYARYMNVSILTWYNSALRYFVCNTGTNTRTVTLYAYMLEMKTG